MLLYGTSAFANVTLKATNVTISHLSIDSSLNNLAAGAGEKLFYKVIVAQGSYIQALNISLSGGYGNADIYMKRTNPATISSYNWKSRRENNEDNVVCSGLSSGKPNCRYILKTGYIVYLIYEPKCLINEYPMLLS